MWQHITGIPFLLLWKLEQYKAKDPRNTPDPWNIGARNISILMTLYHFVVLVIWYNSINFDISVRNIVE